MLGAAPPCAAIPGANEILSDTSLKWLIVGEAHGTNETPAIFADLACLAASAGRPPMVALELPQTEADAIDAFLTADEDADALERLLQRPIWQSRKQDGRSSKAMALLLTRLRQMKASGQIRGVVPIQPVNAVPGPDFERAMADNLRNASRDGLVLVLVGNVHARLANPKGAVAQFDYMAQFLPRDRTLSLDAANNGGAVWACYPDRTRKLAESVCGVHDSGAPPVQRSRGIVRLPDKDGVYSGYLNLGVVTTAAPPAVTGPE